MKAPLLLVGILILAIISPLWAAAPIRDTVTLSFTRDDPEQGSSSASASITISGHISKGTVEKFKKSLSRLHNIWPAGTDDFVQSESDSPEIVQVKLNSSGGDMDAAMEIGRLLRSHHGYAIVTKEAICTSSCVFILAGAILRSMQGRVGIHRPYFETQNISLTEEMVGAAMAHAKDKMKKYLASMNVDPVLGEDMMKIPPEKMRYLSANDLVHYGLLDHDPVAYETATLREAQKWGISRQEYMKRRDLADSICSRWDLAKVGQCYDDVFGGKRKK